jgi:choline dehydrogenase-like flavoprotein
MSADPKLGVTGVDGAVHGVDGLYVADASLFPSSLGVNPMMTVSAMSAHVARGLASALTG